MGIRGVVGVGDLVSLGMSALVLRLSGFRLPRQA